MGKKGRPRLTKRIGEEQHLQDPVYRNRHPFQSPVYGDKEEESGLSDPPPPSDDDDDDDEATGAGGMSADARGNQGAVSAPVVAEDEDDNDMRADAHPPSSRAYRHEGYTACGHSMCPPCKQPNWI